MKRTSDAKRAACIAALLEGQAVSKVAADYKVSEATASRLRKAIPPELLQEIETKKGQKLANLIAGNLERSFEAIGNILEHTKNVDWLNKQSADELATFLGVTSDKVFRVLEAIENARPSESNEEWPEVVRQDR